MEERVYSRKFLRIKPDFPLYGKATIVRIGESQVHAGDATVRILDISPGGLRFSSNLRFPVDSSVILKISLILEGCPYFLQGRVIHRSISEACCYEYGFCYIEPDLKLRETLIKLFNNMLIGQNRHIIILRLN